MIVLKQRNGETVILGTDQEKLLSLVLDFAIQKAEEQPELFNFGGTLTQMKHLRDLFKS